MVAVALGTVAAGACSSTRAEKSTAGASSGVPVAVAAAAAVEQEDSGEGISPASSAEDPRHHAESSGRTKRPARTPLPDEAAAVGATEQGRQPGVESAAGVGAAEEWDTVVAVAAGESIQEKELSDKPEEERRRW